MRRNRVQKICLYCKKSFEVRYYRKDTAKFCSVFCYGNYMRAYICGENSSHWKGGKAEILCTGCGKAFKVKRYKIKKGNNLYCSRECQANSNRGEQSPLWKEKISRICPICKKEFFLKPSIVFEENFCSRRCRGIHGIITSRKSDTNIEQAMKVILEKAGIGYIPQYPLKNISVVDFFIPPNIAIYCDGEYWHDKLIARERDKKQTKALMELGIRVIRFPGKEILSFPKTCLEKISEEALLPLLISGGRWKNPDWPHLEIAS